MIFFSLSVGFFSSVIGVYIYQRFSISRKIIAEPNFRTLHKHPIPSGGGIIFALAFTIGIFYFWISEGLSIDFLLVFSLGGLAATIFGFIDDLINISAKNKLLMQSLLSSWAFYWLDASNLFYFDWLYYFIALPVTLMFLIWMINAYNFIDGIDGMAISTAIFASGSITLILLLTRPESQFIFIFGLLFAVSIGFIFFNWPPASIFMGDAGSIFFGYVFGSIIVATVLVGDLSIWTWVIIFGYFISDLVVTQIARVILVKKWYLAHRSHAYQNLARILDSHLKVTISLILYNILWILPLTFWSVLDPEIEIIAVVLALGPALIVSYKYGPVLSAA